MELRHRYDLGEALLRQGRQAEALSILEAVAKELTHDGQEATAIRVHAALHRAYKMARRYKRALDHAEAWQVLEMRRMASQFATQAKLTVNRIQMEMVQVKAEVERLRSKELEREKQALQSRAEELHRQAKVDRLTGLANRLHLEEVFPALMEPLGGGNTLAVVVADLDHFKRVNDTYGHLVGDEVLQAVALLLRRGTRPDDVVARLGGEEFVLLLPGADAEQALQVCERLRAAVQAHPWEPMASGLAITMSMGLFIASNPVSPRAALEFADQALYRAKKQGRNCIRLHGPEAVSAH